MITAPYEIETHEVDDDTTQPAEQLWTPCADGAADNGFIAHRGLYVTGIDDATDDSLCLVGFIVLRHQRWADIIEAAAAYTAGATSTSTPATTPWCSPPASCASSTPTVPSYGTRTQTARAAASRRAPGAWSRHPRRSPAPPRPLLCVTRPPQ